MEHDFAKNIKKIFPLTGVYQKRYCNTFMESNEIILNVVFFRTLNGSEPVREWLFELPQEQRKAIGTEIKVVQYG